MARTGSPEPPGRRFAERARPACPEQPALDGPWCTRSASRVTGESVRHGRSCSSFRKHRWLAGSWLSGRSGSLPRSRVHGSAGVPRAARPARAPLRASSPGISARQREKRPVPCVPALAGRVEAVDGAREPHRAQENSQADIRALRQGRALVVLGRRRGRQSDANHLQRREYHVEHRDGAPFRAVEAGHGLVPRRRSAHEHVRAARAGQRGCHDQPPKTSL